jgi:P4 family phage/plasmid primase-like protien
MPVIRHPAARDDDEDVRPRGMSDDVLALNFTARHRDELRYCAGHAAWYQFIGGRWVKDSTLHVFDLVRAVLRDAQEDVLAFDPSKPAQRERLIHALRSAKTVAAVERLARSDRAHAITPDQLDAEDWLLNTPSGEVNLTSGILVPHDPLSYHTKQTAVAPADTADCPTWMAFLQRVTGGDDAMIDYLQAVAGYALAGVVSEHVLLFLWGAGANGKSTFANVLTGILGDYAAIAPMEVFVEQPGQAHPTELAMLAGARLVTATETDPGRRWATARVKAMTGGDPITARFMRADFFTFRPRFLLILSGNHRPHLGAVDEAMRRRLHLVPFDQHIPAAERDPHLPERLREEWPGILRWMIEGCLQWQRKGLRPPARVVDTTGDYMAQEDTLGNWLEAATTPDLYAFEASSDLYRDYADWCTQTGEKPLPLSRLVSALQDRGLRKTRTKQAKGFEGRRLRPLGERPWLRPAP